MRKKTELIKNLQILMKYIFRKENLTVSYTADETGYAPLEEKIAAFKENLYTDEVEPGSIVYDFEQKNEAFQTSGQVQYVALCGNFEREGYDYTGALRILRVMLSYDYLWINIRVKGGAYGCMNGYMRNGDTYFVSYRDPNLSATNEIYDGIPAYLEKFDADEREMTGYIIGTISDMDTPMNPSARCAFDDSLSAGAGLRDAFKGAEPDYRGTAGGHPRIEAFDCVGALRRQPVCDRQ